MVNMKTFLSRALDAADLMQNYVDIAVDKIDILSQDEKDELGRELQHTDANGPEEAAALAIIAYILKHDTQVAKPPEGCIWVEVDPFDFEQADDGDTTHYGGEIRVTNDTNVDIVIQCSGDDRGDDYCYWPTTKAILDALFVDGVPGVEDGDYATHWEDFHDALCRLIKPTADSFYVFVRDLDRSVVILDASGNELTHGIPDTTPDSEE